MNAVARKVRDAIGEAALVGFDSLDQIRGLLHEAATEIESLQIDRDEWRTQHDNLLSVRATDNAALLANADRADRMAKINMGVVGKLAERNDDLRARATAAEAQVARLKAALEPFRSGGGWGKFLAWLVNGAPTREVGIAASKQIVSWKNAVDAALSNTAADKGDGHE